VTALIVSRPPRGRHRAPTPARLTTARRVLSSAGASALACLAIAAAAIWIGVPPA
jgi:hypothetical protein